MKNFSHHQSQQSCWEESKSLTERVRCLGCKRRKRCYVCGRFKERKGDDYCDPATIERDEVEDDGE